MFLSNLWDQRWVIWRSGLFLPEGLKSLDSVLCNVISWWYQFFAGILYDDVPCRWGIEQGPSNVWRLTLYLLDVCVVEIHPSADLRLEEEGGVMFPVVTHHAHQVELRLTGLFLRHPVEQLTHRGKRRRRPGQRLVLLLLLPLLLFSFLRRPDAGRFPACEWRPPPGPSAPSPRRDRWWWSLDCWGGRERSGAADHTVSE